MNYQKTRGWKTVTGSIVIIISAVIASLSLMPESMTELITAFGQGLVGVGIGHKVKKSEMSRRELFDDMFQ